jgi:glycosyltransferase involved in cell wall biosynthesis
MELASVIIPCRNPKAWLLETIASARAQQHACIEVVLVDDGSDEPESRVVLERAARLVDRYIQQPHQGVSAARNAAIAVARGSFLVPLDSVDLFERPFVSACIDALQAHPEAAFAYTNYRVFGHHSYVEELPAFNFFDLLHRNTLPYASVNMLTQTRFSISYVRPESHQLFFLFVRVWESMTLHPLEFLRATAIGDRNIVIMKDPHSGHCYQKGVSEEYNSLDGIVRWQREQLASQFPHVTEIFCAGASAGASPAIYTGYHLGARAAWSLGGRIVKPEKTVERDRAVQELYKRVIGRPIPTDCRPKNTRSLWMSSRLRKCASCGGI